MSRQRAFPVPLPLAVWERDGLAAALAKEGLPTDAVTSSALLFWRFESDALPVGFGGLELFGNQALLHAVVTLPPLRGRGIGSSMVEALEMEARIRGARTMWVAAEKNAEFFARLDYRACKRGEAPEVIRDAPHFARSVAAKAMMKQLG